ncbi:MAG TPA: FAD-binding oxidoreductase [Acidimicrobiia bacterium]|nr:FAD-binding oxidoreductase [Acidimicrobiia bacterium]
MSTPSVSGYDAVVIGSGSVGTPIALSLAEAGLSVGVFDPCPSPGRGDNRAAIGGIRATHSEPAKATLCRESIEVFARWREDRGDDIEWRRGGYLFVAYRGEDAEALRTVVAIQRDAGLDIDWVGPDRVAELAPGIHDVDLLGGTFSPGDGSASPLRAVHSFRVWAERAGARFHFGEPVTAIDVRGNRVVGVTTPEGVYPAPMVVNAAGADAPAVARMVGVELAVTPEGHEAGVTEPVERFLDPMVVDLRPGARSKNVYLYQSATGQVLFSIAPRPAEPGADRRVRSEFLPEASARLVGLMPRLGHLKIRRTWRGLYPMTPDGSPLVGWCGPEGHLVAAGMCGQGFMLGPGIGRCLARLVTGAATPHDDAVLEELRPERAFGGAELLR